MIQPTFLGGGDETMLARLLRLKAAGIINGLKEYTVTGNPVSFKASVAKSLRQMLIPFTPVQAGSGDPSPQNPRSISGFTGIDVARAGKNLFNKAYLSDPASYKNIASGYPYTDAIRLAPNTKYTISPSSTEQLETANYYVLYINPSETDPDYLVITNQDVRYPVTAGTPKEITFTTGATGVVRFGTYTNSLSAFMSVDWQIEVGETATAYEPYVEQESHHIEFPVQGKNVFPHASVSGQATTLVEGLSIPPGTYTFSALIRSTDTDKSKCLVSFYNGSRMIVYKYLSRDVRTSSTFTVDEEITRIWFYASESFTESAGDSFSFEDIQLEAGSTATSYEPYDNTIYGGELDLTTGVLTVTHISKTVHKSDFGDEIAGTGIPYRNANGTDAEAPSSGINWVDARKTQIMNCGKIANPYSETSFGDYIGVAFYASNTGTQYRISEPLYDDLSDNDDIVYCYELATPRTIQLDPVTIQTLQGDNTIWSDTNGDNTVIYLSKKE